MTTTTDIFERINLGEFGNDEAAFRSALYEYCEVVGNPRAGRCYDLAYDFGHSSGFSEIANYFVQLSDLIKPMPIL